MSVMRCTIFKDTAFVVAKSISTPSANKWNLIVGSRDAEKLSNNRTECGCMLIMRVGI